MEPIRYINHYIHHIYIYLIIFIYDISISISIFKSSKVTPDRATSVARSLRGELVGVVIVVSGDALMQVHWGMFCACDDGDLKRAVQCMAIY